MGGQLFHFFENFKFFKGGEKVVGSLFSLPIYFFFRDFLGNFPFFFPPPLGKKHIETEKGLGGKILVFSMGDLPPGAF